MFTESKRYISPVFSLLLVTLFCIFNYNLLEFSNIIPSTLPEYQCTNNDGRWIFQNNSINATNWKSLEKSVGYSCEKFKFFHFCSRKDEKSLNRVYQSLLYEWKPYCDQTERFNPEIFINKLGTRNLTLIGDSITQEHAVSLYCLLGEYILTNIFSNQDQIKWENEGKRDRSMLRFQLKSKSVVTYYRHDRLAELHTYKPSANYINILSQSNIVVFNSMLHWKGKNQSELLIEYKKVSDGIMEDIRLNYPNLNVIYRTTYSGSSNCENNDNPIDYKLNYTGIYNWNQVPNYNNIWRELANDPLYSNQLRILDVELMMSYRPDGHSSPPRDCLHYCLPGPIDHWNDLLQKMI
jgi:hypothetical protein